MTGLTFPESYANKDWPRRVKQAFDQQLSRIETLEALVSQKTGWASYVDGASPQALAANTDTILTNNMAAVIEVQKPSDVAAFYDGTVITGRNGDGLGAHIQLTFTPDDGVASMLTIWVDIGGGFGKLFFGSFPITLGSGMAHMLSHNFFAYNGATWAANGGTVYVRSDGPGVITGKVFDFHRLHKALT